MMLKQAIFGAFLGSVAVAGSAQASTITESYSFRLQGFADVTGSLSSPLTSISGAFTVTFDPTLSYSNATTDLSAEFVTGAAPTLDSALGFSYNPVTQLFSLGGIENGASDVVAGTNDFVLQLILSDPSAPQLGLCSSTSLFTCGTATGNSDVVASGYTTTGTGGVWLAAASDSSVIPLTPVGPTPLPAALPLFASGLAGLSLLGWRRKRNAKTDVA